MADVFFILTISVHFLSVFCLGLAIFVLYRGQGAVVMSGDAKVFLSIHYLGIIFFHVGAAGNIIIRYFKGLEEDPAPDFYTVNQVSLVYQHLFHLGTVVGTLAGMFYIVNLWHGLVQALEARKFERVREFLMAPNRMKLLLGVTSVVVLIAHVILFSMALITLQPVADAQWIQLISAVIKIFFLIIMTPVMIDLYSTIKVIKSYKQGKSSDVIRPVANLLAVVVFLYLLLAFDVQDNLRRCIYPALFFSLPRNDPNHTWLIGKIQINIFYLLFAFIGMATAYPVLYKVFFRPSPGKKSTANNNDKQKNVTDFISNPSSTSETSYYKETFSNKA